MRAGLARLMQTYCYGPSQPIRGKSRIPCARETDAPATACESITRTRESKAAETDNGAISRARERRSSATNTHTREGESFVSNSHTRERENERNYKNGDKRARDNTGTSRAKRTWGGARNCRDRVTTALSQRHAEGVLQAMAVADLAGIPLIRHWIVDYELAGIADRDGAAFVGKLLALCGRYVRAKGGRFAAVWVREVGRRNGAHVHIALHWPRGWKLGYLTRRWIKAAGGQYRKGVSRIRPVGGSLNCAWTSPDLYRENLERLGSYFTKGSDSAVAAELGLELLKPGGTIVGKRWGRTQNLGQRPNRAGPNEIFTPIP